MFDVINWKWCYLLWCFFISYAPLIIQTMKELRNRWFPLLQINLGWERKLWVGTNSCLGCVSTSLQMGTDLSPLSPYLVCEYCLVHDVHSSYSFGTEVRMQSLPYSLLPLLQLRPYKWLILGSFLPTGQWWASLLSQVPGGQKRCSHTGHSRCGGGRASLQEWQARCPDSGSWVGAVTPWRGIP